MKKDRLEEFVHNHRDEFDFMSPSPELWGRISEAGKTKKKIDWFQARWMKVAAVVVVVFCTSLMVYQSFGPMSGNARRAALIDPEIRTLLEAEAFYAQQVNGKLEEIRKCYEMVPELQLEVEGDLQELETMYNELKKDLKDNMSNKNVIEAMIENNRYRLQVVDDVLAQIKC